MQTRLSDDSRKTGFILPASPFALLRLTHRPLPQRQPGLAFIGRVLDHKPERLAVRRVGFHTPGLANLALGVFAGPGAGPCVAFEDAGAGVRRAVVPKPVVDIHLRDRVIPAENDPLVVIAFSTAATPILRDVL